jgi:hypothetical protein
MMRVESVVQQPWHEASHAPQAEARPMTTSAVLDLLNPSNRARSSHVLWRVLRTDCEVRVIFTRTNHP